MSICEGAYSEIYNEISEDADGMSRLFKQFSFPGGIGSHCTPETPGSNSVRAASSAIRVSHALRRCLRQPGSARPPSWSATAKQRPGRSRRRGIRTVLQSGARRCRPAGAASQRLQDRKSDNSFPASRTRSWKSLFFGYGYDPYFVEGSDPETMHQAMAATLNHCVQKIGASSRKRAQMPPGRGDPAGR